MLAPIARLLHISLDILLSFHENLTDLEIEELIHKMDKMFSEEGFEKTYQWAVNTIKEYPNCNLLIWQLAAMAVNIPLLLPSPVAVLQRLWQLCGEGEFWYTVLTSLCRILLGFAAGVAAGVLLAAAAWRWQFVQAMVRPMVGVLKSTPVASFIILALVWVKTEQLATLISYNMVLPLVYNNL